MKPLQDNICSYRYNTGCVTVTWGEAVFCLLTVIKDQFLEDKGLDLEGSPSREVGFCPGLSSSSLLIVLLCLDTSAWSWANS